MAETNPDNPIGTINPPSWLEKHGSIEVGPGFGLITFFNNVLKIITIIAGLVGVFNLITAGLDFITSGGETEKINKAWNKIWQSLWGLIVIAASFTIAAILGWLLFGDASIIIKPKIYGPGIEQ